MVTIAASLSRFHQAAGEFKVGDRGKFDRQVFTRRPLHTDGACCDDKVTAHDIEMHAAAGAHAYEVSNPGHVKLLHTDGRGRTAHAGRHDKHRFAFQGTEPCRIFAILPDKAGIIQKGRYFFHPTGISRQDGVLCPV